MSTYTTIADLKQQLNIELTHTEEDTYLQQILNVAEYAIAKDCNYGLTGYTTVTMPVTIKQAMLMLAGHLYLNRTPVTFAQAVEIPYSIKYLIGFDKNLIAG